jgi:hypothetical protein
MASMVHITGMPELMSRLKGAGKRIEMGVTRGLVKGGRFLQRESQKIVPVQTGNLRGSAFTRKLTAKHVTVGYTASYAAFVHENLDAAHGRAFNVKHAAAIARANRRLRFKQGKVVGQKAGERRSTTFFNRGENQQAKFLERPAREKRLEILNIVAAEARLI